MNKLYFDFYEMFHSDTAEKFGWDNTTNNPDILTNIMNLIYYVLNPLREKLGKPIYIESGYRCEKLRAYLGGARTGHPEGMCADLKVKGMTQLALFEFIRKSGIEYDQLIIEYNGDKGVCIHIGYNKGNNRKQTLVRTINNGKYVYKSV